jgi:hypothetical protein
MDGKQSSLGLYIGIIALLLGVANVFLGVLPAVEMKGKIEALETRVAKAEKTADSARNALKEAKMRRGGGAPAPAPMPAPAPAPTPPLPAK